MRTLITNGTIVTADGSSAADVLIDGETIAQIGRDLAAAGRPPTRRSTRPASTSSRAASTSTPTWSCRSAAPSPRTRSRPGRARRRSAGRPRSSTSPSSAKGQSLREGLDAWHAKAEGNAVADYGFHMIMSDVNDDTLAEMDGLVAEGVPDFKLFTAYPGVFYSDDGAIFRAMQQTAKNGGLIMMHAENGMAIDVVAAQTVEAGTTDPIGHGLARKAIFEGEATNRVIRLAEAAGVPVYIVHLSAREALAEVRGARDRGAKVVRRDLPAVPLPVARRHGQRVRGRQVRLLAAPADRRTTGTTSGPASSRTTSSSSRPTTARSTSTARRSLAAATSARSRTACPGVEDRVDLLHDGGVVGGRITRERWVEIISTAPAKMFGMYPQKGAIAVGSDADIVVYDPNRRRHDLRDDAPHGRRLLVLRGPGGPGRQRRRAVARLRHRPGRRVHRAEGPRQVHQARAGGPRPRMSHEHPRCPLRAREPHGARLAPSGRVLHRRLRLRARPAGARHPGAPTLTPRRASATRI